MVCRITVFCMVNHGLVMGIGKLVLKVHSID